jgi:hypothetical protein
VPACKAYVRPRPTRVAFLVEENEHWKPMLDAIFDECYTRWGGRFYLVVPCDNGQVRPAYLPWLDAYDADIIYSYVDLGENIVEQLHERLYPAFLVKHNFRRSQGRGPNLQPGLPFTPLTALSVAGALARGNGIGAPQPIPVVDIDPRATPSQLLQENFGCYHRNLGLLPMAHDMAEFLRPVTYVPPDLLRNPTPVPSAEPQLVPPELDLLEQIASQRDLCGLAQISASCAPRQEILADQWSETVNVVVGDSFTDRVTFWNARHRLPVWLHTGIVTLRLSHSDVQDEAIFRAITHIIARRIHVRRGQASNSHIVIRSASLSQPDLEQVTQRFGAMDPFNEYSFEKLESIDSCVPTEAALSKRSRQIDPASAFAPHDWHEFSVSEDVFRPPNIAPRHVREAPQPSGAKRGLWAIDVDIERTVDYSRFDNVQHHWRLPRRLRMTGAFTPGYTLGNNGPFCMPRASAGGLLTLFSDADGGLPEVRAPGDKTAFSTALCMASDWVPFSSHQTAMLPARAVEIRSSDKGRYLTALLRLAGGIHRAKAIFLCKFWKDQFESLGATPTLTEARRSQVVQTLRKRLRQAQIGTDEDWNRLAQVVLSEARAVRLDPRYLKYDALTLQFEDFRNAFWATHEAGEPRSNWDERERQSLSESIKYLCQHEILHQGHEWRCDECYNNNWVALDDLKRSMICDVCGAKRPAPVADPWHFRLNSFITEGLREHGLLASMWCLAKFAERANASFFYLEPHELFYSEESVESRRPDAELDLLVVMDGKVRLCEAKSSSRRIDIAKLADLARRLRPDIVTLAVMEPMSNGLQQRLTELQRLVRDFSITTELVTLANDDIEDSPTLPTGKSIRVRLL